jgi:hypothetical protein
MSDSISIYDISTDEKRPVTQADVNQLQESLFWHVDVREIVSGLTGQGASKKFSRDQLRQVRKVLWPETFT